MSSGYGFERAEKGMKSVEEFFERGRASIFGSNVREECVDLQQTQILARELLKM